jgi:hypothetical protein
MHGDGKLFGAPLATYGMLKTLIKLREKKQPCIEQERWQFHMRLSPLGITSTGWLKNNLLF